MLEHLSFPQGSPLPPAPPSPLQGFGVNINEKISLKSSMINDSLKVTNVPLSLKVEDVDSIAHYLVEKFRNPGGLKFYQKVAWYVPRGTIDRLVATAFERGSSPARYFTALVKKELG